jgi:hypothetical protein
LVRHGGAVREPRARAPRGPGGTVGEGGAPAVGGREGGVCAGLGRRGVAHLLGFLRSAFFPRLFVNRVSVVVGRMGQGGMRFDPEELSRWM